MTARSRAGAHAVLFHAFTCLLMGLTCGMASAQDASTLPHQAAPHRVGPFSISPEIAVRDIGVDSNVYNSVANPVSDVTFTTSPTIDATARIRRGTVSLHSTTDLVYFVRAASERSLNESLAASVQYPLRRLTLGGSTTYLNTRERPSEEIDARSRRIEQGTQGSAAVAIGSRMSVQLLGSKAQTTYEADAVFRDILLGDTLNRTTDTLRVSGRYTLTPLTTVVATTESQGTTFEHSPERNGDSRQYLFGLELQPRALVSGSFALGHETFSPRSDVMPPFAGFVGNGTVSVRLRPTAVIGFGYDRNLYYSYWDVAPYYIRAGFDLLFRRTVGARWAVELNTGRYRHRYSYITTSAPIVNADQTVLDSGVSATYQAGPRTRVVVGLAYQHRGASALPGYSGVQLGTSIVYGF